MDETGRSFQIWVIAPFSYMKAYLFTAWVNRFQQGHFVDSCSSIILAGLEEEQARQWYEQHLLSPGDTEQSGPAKIGRIVTAPVLEQLLTEAGPVPIDWKQLAEDSGRDLETAQSDDFEQGYWVDCNQYLLPGKLAGSVDVLQRELPEDIRSGLNWNGERNYLFIVNVLSPPKPWPDPAAELEDMDREEDLERPSADEFDQPEVPFPELAEKDLAVVVKARNAIVAAWLWRKHAQGTPLAENVLQISPWTTVALLGQG